MRLGKFPFFPTYHIRLVYASFIMITLSSFQQSVLLTNLFFITGISIAKTLGSPTDHETKAVLEQCLNNATLYSNYGDGTPGFGFGQCPHLIECVLSSSSEANKAGMSAGASIAALIPTMLALIGPSSPLHRFPSHSYANPLL